jgi:hypothetical protein
LRRQNDALLALAGDSVILTGDEMQREGVHPLRCVYLGRFDDVRRAKAKAIELRAFDEPPELVIASNIRIACDRRQTTRWRLSEQEIDLLHTDSLGTSTPNSFALSQNHATISARCVVKHFTQPSSFILRHIRRQPQFCVAR